MIETDILKEIYEAISADRLFEAYLRQHPTLVAERYDAIISVGKAANEMAKTAQQYFGTLPTLIVCPQESNDYNLPNAERTCADHPQPSQASLQAGEALQAFIQQRQGQRLLFLVSGGGSSLVERLSGISLYDYNSCITQLMNGGADINEVNTCRKHLSAIKGGRLLPFIHPDSHAYILCDIPDNSYHNVAGGLTFADESTVERALQVLHKYDLDLEYAKFLQETPKDTKGLPYSVIGNMQTLLDAIKQVLSSHKLNVSVSDYQLRDYASICGLNIGCQIFKHMKAGKGQVAIVYGGEASVLMRGNGIGGRALETALAIAIEIQGLKGVSVVSACTDGKDGNSPTSGVIITGDTAQRMYDKGFRPDVALRNNDSYTVLKECAEIIPSFYPNSNLNDFVIVFIN